MTGKPQTAGDVLKILAVMNPQDGRGDLRWIHELAGTLDQMLEGYALVQTVDSVEVLDMLPVGTDVYSADEQCLLTKTKWGAWYSQSDLWDYGVEAVIEQFGGLFTVHVPQTDGGSATLTT